MTPLDPHQTTPHVAGPDDTAPTAPSAPDAGAPAVPGYELLGELGRGGMGVVYRARQLGLDRTVAVKLAAAGRPVSADGLARFRREAEALARVHHPNVVQIYEVGD